MARGKRGGYQKPARPAAVSGPGALSARTDGKVPQTLPSGGDYGDRTATQTINVNVTATCAAGASCEDGLDCISGICTRACIVGQERSCSAFPAAVCTSGSFEASGGAVSLTGYVPSYAQKRLASRAAQRVGLSLEEIRDELVEELGLTSLHVRSVRRDLEALQAASPERFRIDNVYVAYDGVPSGEFTVEVDDKEPKFAADLANAHATEITKLLGRLAVSEAQQRRVFFDQQLKDFFFPFG